MYKITTEFIQQFGKLVYKVKPKGSVLLYLHDSTVEKYQLKDSQMLTENELNEILEDSENRKREELAAMEANNRRKFGLEIVEKFYTNNYK